MRQLRIFVLICVCAVMAACASSESKLYGVWQEMNPVGKVIRTIELNKDHTGNYYFTNVDNVRKDFVFKWEWLRDNRIRIDSPGTPIFLKLDGSRLVDPDNFRYSKKQ